MAARIEQARGFQHQPRARAAGRRRDRRRERSRADPRQRRDGHLPPRQHARGDHRPRRARAGRWSTPPSTPARAPPARARPASSTSSRSTPTRSARSRRTRVRHQPRAGDEDPDPSSTRTTLRHASATRRSTTEARGRSVQLGSTGPQDSRSSQSRSPPTAASFHLPLEAAPRQDAAEAFAIRRGCRVNRVRPRWLRDFRAWL